MEILISAEATAAPRFDKELKKEVDCLAHLLQTLCNSLDDVKSCVKRVTRKVQLCLDFAIDLLYDAGGDVEYAKISDHSRFPWDPGNGVESNEEQEVETKKNIDGDLSGGSQEEDKKQNAGIAGIIKGGEEDEKSDYNSSFTFLQLCTLAISTLLLCFVALYPKFDKKNEAIPAVGLIMAALASRISLEIMSKRPLFARSCGFLAVLSLIVALASFVFI